jgi:hypothetical protein
MLYAALNGFLDTISTKDIFRFKNLVRNLIENGESSTSNVLSIIDVLLDESDIYSREMLDIELEFMLTSILHTLKG